MNLYCNTFSVYCFDIIAIKLYSKEKKRWQEKENWIMNLTIIIQMINAST